MARWIGVDENFKSFKNRGYTWISPTEQECREMGWHEATLPYTVTVEELEGRSLARQWVKDTFWLQDYSMFAHGSVYFKHKKDAVFFKLKWA